MKIYLVGGAVRDEILGIQTQDQDYVVVGSSELEMLKLGFTKVGADFPVFLHPVTREEYALARSEKKVARGHVGFEYEWEGVTLTEDLFRRDLTINAIAKDLDTGEYIDPFGGITDIKNKVLKHVSRHFIDDPLRVLRVARFLCQFEGFVVFEETTELCKKIAMTNEIESLSGERIWTEMQKALATDKPIPFFEFLKNTKSLDKFLPELARLEGVPQKKEYHPEGDVWTHTMLVLGAACKLDKNIDVRFAALVHDLGKGVTPSELLPSHHRHESTGHPLVENVCDRLHVSSKTKRLALKVTKHHLQVHRSMEMRPSKIVNLLKQLEAFRNIEFFEQVLTVCMADDFGKLRNSYIQADYLRYIASEIRKLDIKNLIKNEDQVNIPEIIFKQQIQIAKIAAKNFLNKSNEPG